MKSNSKKSVYCDEKRGDEKKVIYTTIHNNNRESRTAILEFGKRKE
jgi:hypothetical protein